MKEFRSPVSASNKDNCIKSIYFNKGNNTSLGDMKLNTNLKELNQIASSIEKNMSNYHDYFISHCVHYGNPKSSDKKMIIPDFNHLFGMLTNAYDIDDTVNDDIRIQIHIDSCNHHKSGKRHMISAHFDKNEVICAMPDARAKSKPYHDALELMNKYIEDVIYPWYGEHATGNITVNHKTAKNKDANGNGFSLSIGRESYLIKPLFLNDNINVPEVIIKLDINNSKQAFTENYKSIIEKTHAFLLKNDDEFNFLSNNGITQVQWVFHFSNKDKKYYACNETEVLLGNKYKTFDFIPYPYDQWVRAFFVKNSEPAVTDEMITEDFIKTSEYTHVYSALQKTFYENLDTEELLNIRYLGNLSFFESIEEAHEFLEELNLNDRCYNFLIFESKEKKYIITAKDKISNGEIVITKAYLQRLHFKPEDYFELVDYDL